MKASEIANLLGLSLRGKDTLITCLCPIDDPKEGGLSFIKKASLVSPEAFNVLSAILVTEEVSQEISQFTGALLIASQPQKSLIDLIPHFYPNERPGPQIHATAVIDPATSLPKDISVGAYVVIGSKCSFGSAVTIYPHVVIYSNVSIGSNVAIHSGAVIREGTRIGSNCTLQPGAVIGGDGFGYVPDPVVGIKAVPQVGTVELADGVDVGANSCIDRAAIGTTKINRGTKIDNLVQLGHNVRIGEFSMMCGQAGVAGSTTLGNRVILGGQSGIADHLNIVDDVRIGAHSGVIYHVKEKGDYIGFPAIRSVPWRRLNLTLLKLIGKR